METQYTTAFIGITLSGELFIITQFQGTLIECAKWRKENREEFEKRFGEEVYGWIRNYSPKRTK